MTSQTPAFLEQVATLLDRFGQSQLAAVSRSAEYCASAIKQGGLVHVFGSGHSSLVCQDAFARAGGLIPINLIVGEDLLPHRGLRCGEVERTSGLAAALLETEPVEPGDVLIIVSNSGRNAVPVEMAEAAHARGLRTVAITSLDHSRSVSSRAPSGKRLFEIADVVIDNLGTSGDAAVDLGDGADAVAVGATSSILGAVAIQAICVETSARLSAAGMRPPVFVSANVEGGDAHNRAAFARMGQRLPSLLAADIIRIRDG
jgi:uncharacterized phosphosugar-binding protein